MNRFILLLASGFGAGYSPWAPGTVGTLVGILYFLGLSYLAPLPYFVVLVVFTIFACWVAGRAEKILGEADPGKIVIDEVAGYLFTMMWIPASCAEGCGRYALILAAGFFLFRAMDILKPFPARWIDQKLGGGAGVVLDDVVAGIYANVLLRLCIGIWTKYF